MTALIYAGIALGGIVILQVLLNIVNILQAGPRKPDGRSLSQIIGKDPSTATYDDIERLSRKEKMQAFYAAPAPAIDELNGEFEARLLSGGVLGKATALFTHHVFPTGLITLKTRWVGKAFRHERGDSGSGYNIFEMKTKNGLDILRIRRIRTFVGPTHIGRDRSPSFHIDYRPFNGGTIRSMNDELRRINGSLYIGAGYMGLGGGPSNPAPFALVGAARPWVGPDTK